MKHGMGCDICGHEGGSLKSAHYDDEVVVTCRDATACLKREREREDTRLQEQEDKS